MADKQKMSFVLYKNWGDIICTLPDDMAGKLIKAVFEYQDGQEVNIDNPALAAIFNMFRVKFEEDAEAYEAKKKKNKENIDKRWKNNTTEYQNIPTNTTVYQSIPDTDTVNDTDTDTVNDTDTVTDKVPVKTPEVLAIIDAWNTLPVSIAKVKVVLKGSERHNFLKARIKERGLDDILDAIENIRTSDFLQGKNASGWTITFDWFIKPSNFQKVLERNYNEDGERSSPNSYQKNGDFNPFAYARSKIGEA